MRGHGTDATHLGPYIMRRTINLTDARRKGIALASAYLDVSGEAFIADAIDTYIRATYARMAEGMVTR